MIGFGGRGDTKLTVRTRTVDLQFLADNGTRVARDVYIPIGTDQI